MGGGKGPGSSHLLVPQGLAAFEGGGTAGWGYRPRRVLHAARAGRRFRVRLVRTWVVCAWDRSTFERKGVYFYAIMQ